jgi:S-adenosylmethionine synthetase
MACEAATKNNVVRDAGKITTKAKLDYEMVVRGVLAQIGFDSYVDDLPSVDSKGLSDITCEVLVRINKQSPGIDGGVHVKTPATCGVGGWPTPPATCGVGGWPTPPGGYPIPPWMRF